MDWDRVASDESEGVFNEFIEEQLEELIDGILQDSTLENLAGRGSDIIVEVDQIEPPRFIYEDPSQGGGAGKGQAGPGQDSGKLRFTIPFRRLMEHLGKKLGLPNLTKEGFGKIKEYSQEYKTFGPIGVLLDRKRTFKRALKTSVATKVYDPAKEKYTVLFGRRDRRYKLPERIEKPKYNAVVFYIGDISYSTHGTRLELEKRLVYFIQNWLDFNYGVRNVSHRFFVHDSKAYEVVAEDFFRVGTAGGTEAAIAFDLVSQIALSEYDPGTTNLYAFYFGDGELFGDDQKRIVQTIDESMHAYFNRIGIVEILPSQISNLNKHARTKYSKDAIVRLAELKQKEQLIPVIKALFKEIHATH